MIITLILFVKNIPKKNGNLAHRQMFIINFLLYLSAMVGRNVEVMHHEAKYRLPINPNFSLETSIFYYFVKELYVVNLIFIPNCPEYNKNQLCNIKVMHYYIYHPKSRFYCKQLFHFNKYTLNQDKAPNRSMRKM